MTTIEVLTAAEKNGTLKMMLQKGLISPTVIHQREIYLRIVTHLEDVNNPKMSVSQAIENTIVDLNITETRAWRSWSAMRK
jgi:hypothetical protein